MSLCLQKLRGNLMLSGKWMYLFSRIQQDPTILVFVDTESGLIDNADIHQIGVVRLDGMIRAYKALRKTYGPPVSKPMRGISAVAALQKLHDSGLSRSMIWMEHSVGHFDYRRIAKITPTNLQHSLPLIENVYSTLDLWRDVFLGPFAHKLSHIFQLLHPHDPLLDRRHFALPDAFMCRALFKAIFELF
ncbi:hypothetical protein BP5796_07759 [Coleophoma crateriformis]|uniref:Exonuclease domain-containing protein n=1 Tax=Coleophoma crateriformis TaxID=565419 RepID=A0A3D8RCH1_9HELO|nr:hypothetical protein BP5796_07759 [Coleophoma crateriformis]